jgi:tRNA threonylcarbamoyladenosine biosynthesis protein TsaB
MIVLGVDTSTAAGSVALCEADRLLGEVRLTAGGHHQERLLRTVEALLGLAGVGIDRVEALGVALGPGTFTGLRIGIATVKGIALARGIPAYGLSTLAAMALARRHAGMPVVPLIDAGRSEVYSAVYAGGPEDPALLAAERGGSPEAILRDLPPEPVLLCGDGVSGVRELILGIRDGRDRLEEGPLFLGETLARWAAARLGRGGAWSLADLRPNYIRVPDAEIGRKS